MSRTTSHLEAQGTGKMRPEMPKAEMLRPASPKSDAVKPAPARPASPTSEAAQPTASWPAMPEVDYQALAMASGTAMNALMRANDAMLKGMMAWSQEMSAFANARLRENVERSESLLHCTDPAAAFNQHCEFTTKATQQYLEEASRLMALATQMTSKCWEPIEACTKETLGRMTGGGRSDSAAGNGSTEKK